MRIPWAWVVLGLVLLVAALATVGYLSSLGIIGGSHP